MKNHKAEEATMTFDEKINKVTCQAILAQIKEDNNDENNLMAGLVMHGMRILATSNLESIPTLCMSIAQLPAVTTQDQALEVVAMAVLLAMIEDRDELDQEEVFVQFIQARRAAAVEIAMKHFHGTETVQ